MRGKEAFVKEAMTKPGSCQVRSKTENPCLHPAAVEIRGVPFCGTCAREQEAYFAIGELTQGKRSLRSKPLAEALGRIRRERRGGGVSERCLELPGVDETERLELTIS